MQCDILIQGGEVIDPSQQLRGVRDVAVRDGVILSVSENLTDVEARHTIDARGQYVVPGLIDLHVHVYPGHMPLGLEPDPLCPAGGVTTLLDAGTSSICIIREVPERGRPETITLAEWGRVSPFVSFSGTGSISRAIADRPGLPLSVQGR